ncbi:ABC transporter permease subunit [Corynebacterium sp. 335C]
MTGTRIRAIVGPVAIAAGAVLAGNLLTTMLPWFTGREPALSVLRAREAQRAATPELLARIREDFDLPSTPWESLAGWVSGPLLGDFGPSWVDQGQDAMGAALGGLGISISLTFAALVVSTLIAVAVVTPRLTAAARGRRPGGAAATVLAGLSALPDFVLAVVLMWIFALKLGWFPISGWEGPLHMVLPVIALAVAAGGMYGRVLLISADAACGEAWVESWRVNGVGTGVIARHLLARAFIPTIPILALYFAGTVTATAAVEVTYNIPGFGRTVVSAAQDQDIPVIQAAVTIVLVLGAVIGLLTHFLRRRLLAPLEGDVAGLAAARAPQRGPSMVWAWVALVPLVLVFAGLFRDASIDPTARLADASTAHPLGTDQLGRDLWARLADGAVYSIGVAVIITAVCAVLGIVLGHMGRWVQQIGEALNAMPAILMGLILAGVFGPSTWTAAIAVILAGWIPLAAHCAAVAEEARATGHYRYAEIMGASKGHLLRRHVLPITVPATVRHAVGRIAHNALALAALGFLGVGAVHDSPEWGVVLNEATGYLTRAPWMALGPTVCLVALGVLAAVLTDRRAAKV